MLVSQSDEMILLVWRCEVVNLSSIRAKTWEKKDKHICWDWRSGHSWPWKQQMTDSHIRRVHLVAAPELSIVSHLPQQEFVKFWLFSEHFTDFSSMFVLNHFKCWNRYSVKTRHDHKNWSQTQTRVHLHLIKHVYWESLYKTHVIMGKVILSGKQRHTKVTLVITEMKDYYCWPGSLFLYTYYMFDPFKLF